MDEAFEAVFAEYEARRAREQQDRTATRDERLLPVGPIVGRFINVMVKGLGAKSILELGTSYGYSALWLSEAARETGGRVTSIDVAKDKQDYARERLRRAGLDAQVAFVNGDAVKVLESMPGPFDFVLVDLWKDMYLPCFERFYPKLAPGAVVVADNMIQPASAHADVALYRDAVRSKADLESILLPLGNGIELSRKV